MSGTDYFTYTNLTANTLARASDVNSRVASIQGGFAKLPIPEKLQQGRATYAADTGAANALAVALDFAPSGYTAGLELSVKVAAANSGAATINVNGLGAKSVKRADGTALAFGDLAADQIIKLVYDGTNFRLIAPAETAIANYATAAATSATAAASSATAAATSATSAATSATAAATSATNAGNSATSAAASAASAAAAVSGYVAKAGDTMIGALTLFGAPTAILHAATKKYVDDAVFAAGAYTADGTTITLSAGQFALTTIANNTVLGNVSGGVAKPGALTATQLTTLVNAFTTTLSGAVPAPGSSTGKFLKDDATWAAISSVGTVTNVSVITANGVSGSVANATSTPAITLTLGAITPTSVAASGTVSGSNLTTGGFPASIANNRIVGNVSGSTGAASALTAAQVKTMLGLADIASSGSAADITTGTLAVARGGTGTTTSTGSGSVVLSSAPTLANPVVGTQTAGDNSTKAASTAFVQTALADYAREFLTVTAISANRTLADADNNTIIFCTGATGRTITANSTPSTGFSCILASISTAAWTFSCAGGVYTDGATATVTSVSMPAGARCTAIHKGAGVWLLGGV